MIPTLLASVIEIQSPSQTLSARIDAENGRLGYSLWLDDALLIERSELGLMLDGTDFGVGVDLGEAAQDEIDESYPTRGWHSVARNHARISRIPVHHGESQQDFTLEVRLFDDGLAIRFLVPGAGTRRINGETTSWTLPAQSDVWLAERNNNWKLKSYAGWFIKAPVDQLHLISSQGPVQMTPLVVELAQKGGYLALMEAALSNYSGLRLRATGERKVQADFWEGDAGFEIEGEVVTPWRVTLWSRDLNGLVNSDILTNLNPAPDAELYENFDWIRPGRSVWRWWSSDTGNPTQEREYVEHAKQLGFEFSLVDDGWEAWPNAWSELKGICDFAQAQGVEILVWKDYKDIASLEDNYAGMRAWLDGVVEAGAVGVKIDFMNAESKDRIDFQLAALRETARRQLMVLFHGVQKPSGESRTFPHEITREAIRGLELNKMEEGPIQPAHNAALPFTRFLAGHGDYTPLGYSNPGSTTFAHQLATVILFTSPLQVIADDPAVILSDARTRPALDVLQSIPTLWDETRVLAPSRIGELAVFARRRGDIWFLAAISGAESVASFDLDLKFLGGGHFDAVLLFDSGREGFTRREEVMSSDSRIEISLEAGGGFVARFTSTLR